MKIIYNKVIPCKGFVAINLFGVIFVRKEHEPVSKRTINHEAIHTAQMKEMAYVFFYLCYVVEWLIRLLITRNRHRAYLTISFETEAHQHMHEEGYLQRRKHYSFIKYIRP